MSSNAMDGKNKSNQKKTYQKPAIDEEAEFETLALGCVKFNDQANCKPPFDNPPGDS